MNIFGYFPAKKSPNKKTTKKATNQTSNVGNKPRSAIPGSGSLAPWFGFVAPSHEGTDDVGITGPNGESCALSGLSIANIQVDEMDDGAEPHFVLHFGRCNQSEQAPRLKRLFVSLWKIGGRSHQFEWDQTGIDRLHYITSQESLTKATRPFEMAMMLEITTDGPCGLRQWLCDTAPPFGCHTTTTTTTFTQTSTLHLHKESFAASFQNPSLRCSGDREHIPWATTNTKCERVTLLRHSIDSAICAYHFQDSRCYVWLGAPTVSLLEFLPVFPISPNVLISIHGIDLQWRWSGPCICWLYRFDCREQYGEHFDSWWQMAFSTSA